MMFNIKNHLSIKNEKSKKYIIRISIIIAILMSTIIGVKVLSVSVVSADEIREENSNDTAGMKVNSDKENIFINKIKENGFETTDGSKYSGSTIKKIENLKCSQTSSNENELLTAEITITNGACYQKVKLLANISNEEKDLNINNIYLENKSKIYKEDNINEETIKNIILDEITNKYTYSFEYDGERKDFEIDKSNIKEFNIKQYVQKEDYTIRAEIEGKAQYNNNNIISFSGFVTVSGEPSEGDIRNSRDIVIEKID